MPGLFKNCFSSYLPFCTKKFSVNQQDYRVNLKIGKNGKKPFFFLLSDCFTLAIYPYLILHSYNCTLF